jgi:hypothetical protein
MEEKQSEKSFLSFLGKENTEGVLNIIKIVFNIALIGGIIWSVWYYMSIRNFPDLDFPNLIAYLIAIFVIGLFVIIVFVIWFILPGLMLLGAVKEDTTQRIKSWLEVEKYPKCKISNAHLLYILLSIEVIALLFIYKVTLLLTSEILVLISKILAIVIALIVIIWWLEKNSLLKCSVILSVIFFLFGPLTIAIYFTSHVEMNEGFWVGIFTFCLILLIASILNGQIAIKGFNFGKIVENRSLNNIIWILLIIMTLLIFFSNLVTEELNPFLVAPFRILKIGQVSAKLTLDKDFIREAQLEERGIMPDPLCPTTFKFKILSSLGTEYIVQYPADDTQNVKKCLLEKNKNVKPVILKIPKSKVLLVEYL